MALLDRDGDAGTAAAIQDALAGDCRGRGPARHRHDRQGTAGADQDQVGRRVPRLRRVREVHIREIEQHKAPAGGCRAAALFIRCTQRPTYLGRPVQYDLAGPRRGSEIAAILRMSRAGATGDRTSISRQARTRGASASITPGSRPSSPECMDRLGLSLAHLESKCANFDDAAEVERVFYPEIEKLLLDFFPDATDALVYNHDVFDKDYTWATAPKTRTATTQGKRQLRQPRAQRFERQQRPQEAVNCSPGTRGISAHAALHRGRSRREDAVAAVHVDQSRKADRDRRAVLLCSALGPPSLTSRTSTTTGSTTTASARPPASPTVPSTSGTVPWQQPNEVSMLKCYDPVTDGSVSALVVPYRMHRPDGVAERPVPQERRRPPLCLFLGRGNAACGGRRHRRRET